MLVRASQKLFSIVRCFYFRFFTALATHGVAVAGGCYFIDVYLFILPVENLCYCICECVHETHYKHICYSPLYADAAPHIFTFIQLYDSQFHEFIYVWKFIFRFKLGFWLLIQCILFVYGAATPN